MASSFAESPQQNPTFLQSQRCRDLHKTYAHHCTQVNQKLLSVTQYRNTLTSLTEALFVFLNQLKIADSHSRAVIDAVENFKLHLKPCWKGREAYFKRCVATQSGRDRDYTSDMTHAFAREQYKKAWLAGREVFNHVAELVLATSAKKKKKKKKLTKSAPEAGVLDTRRQLFLDDDEKSEAEEEMTNNAADDEQLQTACLTEHRQGKSKKKKTKAKKPKPVTVDDFDFGSLNLDDTMIDRVTQELDDMSLDNMKDLLIDMDRNIDQNLVELRNGNVKWNVVFSQLTFKDRSVLKSLMTSSKGSPVLMLGVLHYLDSLLKDMPATDKGERRMAKHNQVWANLQMNTLPIRMASVMDGLSEVAFAVYNQPLIGPEAMQCAADYIARKTGEGIDKLMLALTNGLEIYALLCEANVMYMNAMQIRVDRPEQHMLAVMIDALEDALQMDLTQSQKRTLAATIIEIVRWTAQFDFDVIKWKDAHRVAHVMTVGWKQFMEQTRDFLTNKQGMEAISRAGIIRNDYSMPIVTQSDKCIARFCLIKTSAGARVTVPCIVSMEEELKKSVRCIIRVKNQDTMNLMMHDATTGFHISAYTPEYIARVRDDRTGQMANSVECIYVPIDDRLCEIILAN